MTSEQSLAAFVAELTTDSIPDSIRDRAGLTIADTIGAIVGGSTDPAVRSLSELWGERTSGTATVLGTDGIETAPQLAAFCNGAAGTVLELDEGHRFAAGHPAVHVLPALLAEAETKYGNGDAFLRSFVAGYEVAVRTACAMARLCDGYHPHGVWGAVGGAAAVARHRELDPAGVRTAMAIAANYAQHTRFEAATEGATVRNGYAGMSNLAAIVAVDQAEAGFTGLQNGIQRHLGLASDDFDPDVLTDGLGERWELERGYFKRHAACRYTHAVLDAIESLSGTFPIEDVDSVRVETYPAAARLDEPRPKNTLQAKFSVPFAVATALRSGTTGPDAFDRDAITPEAMALAERVSVEVSNEFAARIPEKRGARVTVETATETFEETTLAAKGGEHEPFSEAQLAEKFRELTTPIVGADRTEALWTSAREVDSPRVICTLARR